jgi:hypothetical protein
MAGGLIGAAIAAAKSHAGALAEAAATAASAGEQMAGATGPANPPRTLWAFFVRAWRPFCGWMIGLLLARAVTVPLVQLIRREPVEPTDWTALAAMAGVLFVTRSFERSKGIA